MYVDYAECPIAAALNALRCFLVHISAFNLLSPGGGASGAGRCSARHFAQSIGSGVIGSPIVSFQRVNGLVRRASLDHLVGESEQPIRHVESKLFGSFCIDDELEFGRAHDR
jgi:hypothetical protein